MKTRQGFVSNSSSSSFVIVGDVVSLPDSFKEDIYCIGHSLGDGIDVFPLTKDIYEVLKTKYDQQELLLIEGKGYSEDAPLLNRDDLPPKFRIFSYEKDYHTTDGVTDFIDRYVTHYKGY